MEDPAATILLMGVAALAITFALSVGYYWLKALFTGSE